MVFGTNYNLTDRFAGVNTLNVYLTQCLPIFNSNQNGEPPPSRPSATNNFTIFNGVASRLQSLPYNFSLLLMAMGQYTFSSLYSANQFGVGGLPIGAAYDPSEIVGDQGWSGRAEMRYLVPFSQTLLSAIQLYYYYDGGEIFNLHSLGQPDRQSIFGTGFGCRVHAFKYFDAYTEWAQPLTRPISAVQSYGQNGEAPRVFFGITGRI